ncbi:ankyrin repeat, PH and SEC7 domain containing protein secG [Aplysia californica]|uniref:Ankyrin repeat, PH and SEC7 domain containing protein secG n=1 Tax=Aplysia californica TaxID=6500 RepID=A0ABM0JG31_APLCA|nr:ankyrin repeat, PH and SEC7 domain containing protein secG [Aplysia californica]
MEFGSAGDDVNEFTKLFVAALDSDNMTVVESMIRTKVKDFRFPLDMSQCAIMASARGNSDVLSRLLPLHPRMSYSDSAGRRAIHYAAKNGHLTCVELLLKAGAISNCADGTGFTPLHLACDNGHVDIVSLLVRQCAHINSCRTELGESAVHAAAKAGHVQVMEQLLAYGADLNATARRNKGGETPLHKAVAADKPEMVEFLLQNGAVASIADAYGKSPVHIACERGLLRCLGVLLQREVSLEVRDNIGQTALGSAIMENQTEVAKLLIEQGADVHSVDQNGYSLLHKATMRGNLELMECLVASGSDVNVRTPANLQSPLFTAVSLGKLRAVQRLVDLGADVTLPDVKGHTALHMAQAKIGGDPVEEIILALLKAGGRLDVRDEGHCTPLQRCIIIGVIRRNVSLPCLRLFCQAGSALGPDEFTMGKKSPLFWLAYSGFLPEALYLVRAGWNLGEEIWIVLPGKDERQDRLHEYMVQSYRTVPSLLASCRKTVRTHLSEMRQHREILSSIEQLPIPVPLKNFLLLLDIDANDHRALEP